MVYFLSVNVPQMRPDSPISPERVQRLEFSNSLYQRRVLLIHRFATAATLHSQSSSLFFNSKVSSPITRFNFAFCRKSCNAPL